MRYVRSSVKLGYLLVLLIAVLVAVSACGTAGQAKNVFESSDLRGAVINPPRQLTDFTFASTTGDPFQLSQHHGQTILLYFGYRSCPDFCPTTFAELKQVYEKLNSPKDKLKIVFVTVDPDRDTVENLTPYTQAFNQDFIGLRDDGPALKTLMDEFGVVATKRQVGDSALSYLIDHTASVFLIDENGDLRMQYLYGTDYRDIVHDLQIVLQQA
ncbi:MAG: SCO family protein [Anaerolineae bacterium]